MEMWFARHRYTKGDKVVTACDKTASVWSVATGEKLQTFNHAGVVSTAAFNAKDDKVVTASWDKTSSVWSVATGEKLHSFNHAGVVCTAWFNGEGDKVVTASFYLPDRSNEVS